MLNTTIIGNKIAEARKRTNISQAQLAERLFISSQAVGKWERGESMPDIITFNRLAEILGVDLNYFSESFQSAGNELSRLVTLENQSDELPSGNHHDSSRKKKLSWDMSSGNWVDADFSGLKELNEKFSSSNMQRCKFIGSDLSGLLLKSNNVDSCDFSGSDISRSHIQSSNLGNNSFKDCSLVETELSGSNISNCDFTACDFTGALLKSGNFMKNAVEKAVWNRTTFNGMGIDNIIFEGTIKDCSFENSVFYKVTFRNSTLINTFFKNKNLKRIRFIDSQADRMTYEFLKSGKADLTGLTLLQEKGGKNNDTE
jgi:transcriptional regulator with XRE-family HTH domain